MKRGTKSIVLAGLILSAPLLGMAQERAGLPSLTHTEITLRWEDFKALVERTYVPREAEPAPPREAFLRSAEYAAHLAPGVLTLRGTLKLEVLKKGWIRLPLWPQGTVLAFEGDGALLSREGGAAEVIAKGPGSFTLAAEIAFPATDHPGENELALTLPDAPRNLIDLTAASGFSDILVHGGLAYRSRDGHTFVALPNAQFAMKYRLPFQEATLDRGEEVKLEPRVHLAAYQLLSLGDGVVTGLLVHDYQIRIAKLSSFDIDLPEGIEVFDCTTPSLETWKILERDGKRSLRVTLRAPAEGTVRLIVSFEGAYDPKAGKLRVPRFAPRDIERESGFIAVAAEGAEIQLAATGNLLPADVGELPADVRGYAGNLIGAVKYSGAPDATAVQVTEHDDATVLTAIVETLNATTVLLENGTEATWITLSVKNNRKQFLKKTVPSKEVEVWSLLLDDKPAKPKRTGEEILVPLPRGGDEVTSRIGIVLLRAGGEVPWLGKVDPYLPRFDTPVSEALWTLYLPEGRRYLPKSRSFKPIAQTAAMLTDGSGGLRSLGYLAARALPESAAPSTPQEAKKDEYGDYASKQAATEQLRQEEQVQQQFLARAGASRKGALPVRIALPGGIERLPRITVSRMLMVGMEDTSLPVWIAPAWVGSALVLVQRLAILAAGLFAGLWLFRRRRPRRPTDWALLALPLVLAPISRISFSRAILAVFAIAGATWVALILYRKWQDRRAAATGPAGPPDPPSQERQEGPSPPRPLEP